MATDAAHEHAELTGFITNQLKDSTRWTRSWSFVLNATRFSAAALSAAAAAVLQLKTIPWSEATRADVAAVLAAAATLLGVLSALGSFERKWRANRLMKGSLAELNIQMTDPSCDLGAIRKQLIEITRLRNLEIIGEPSATGKP